jgi:hypothetical protein
LKKLCLESNQKTNRNGVDIFCYKLLHDGGMYYLYVNKTKNNILKEELMYQVGKGAEIKGEYYK